MGTHIKNGILYSSGFDFQPITRATYDALTESEKTKGAYVITDEDIQSTNSDQVTYGSGTVKDALDDLAEFSESETISGCGLTFKFYKLGNIGKMQIQSGTTTAISADTVVCTAPIGFRPRIVTRGLIVNGTGTGLCIGNYIIATDGRVIFKNALSSGMYARGECDYFISFN